MYMHTHRDTRMTWLVFLSAMMGTFTYNVFTMYIMGEENFEGMVTFGPKKSYRYVRTNTHG